MRVCVAGDDSFFVLHGNCLFYYKSEELSEVIGVMWLEGCRVEEAPEVLEGLYGFTITTLGGREVKLMAETVEDRSEWVAAIRDCSFAKAAENIRAMQNQVEELRAASSRAKSDLAQAESARDVLQREFDALLQEHNTLKEQYEALLESKANKTSTSLVVRTLDVESLSGTDVDLTWCARAVVAQRSRSGCKPRRPGGARACAGDGPRHPAAGESRKRDAFVRRQQPADFSHVLRLHLCQCRGILPRTLPVWANEALAGKGSAARIWVGSWNMGANEPFAGMDRGRAPKLLRNFVPYVLLLSKACVALNQNC